MNSLLRALLDDPARRQQLSDRGRIRARDFDRRHIKPMIEDLFTRVVLGSNKAFARLKSEV